ncbi:VCBS repeat-containing protein [Haloferula sp. BvORR071]|uniref:FG-GAP repeat domain-containing protein n=1 Tax=Haloferula sp. BvORR071 TaxID=1396141 RepID=UPI0005513875|nr:VCBS repeat-containing protein [Haloferula sp. BvORR071]
MPLLYPRALPLSFLVLTFPASTWAAGGDTDYTTPPRIDFISPSSDFSTHATYFTVADLDGDGNLDLVHLPNNSTAVPGDPHAYWIENQGGRQFGRLRLVHLAPTDAGQTLEDSAAVVNLTGDSKPEIFVSRRYSPQQSLYLPLALTPDLLDDGNAAPVVPLELRGFANSPWQRVDLEGTGQTYLFQAFDAEGAGTATMSIYKRNGGTVGQRFLEAFVINASYFDTAEINHVESHDIDGDGDYDLCVETRDDKVRFYERLTHQTYSGTPRILQDVYAKTQWLDLDGDGRTDILSSDFSWQKNLGGWNFSPQETPAALVDLQYPTYHKVVARAGQSALLHAIVPTEDQSGYELVSIAFDSAEPLSRQPLPGAADGSTVFLHLGDVDGDGQQDLVYSSSAAGSFYGGSRTISIAWGSPSGFLAGQTVWEGPGAAYQVFSADFNQDHCPDLVSGPYASGDYRIHFNRGAAGPDEGVVINGLQIPGTTLRILGAVPIDKDKYPDLVCRYTPLPADPANPKSALVVVRGRKDGSFIPPVIPAGGLVYTPGLAFDSGVGPGSSNDFIDWDRDGDLDLIAWGQWFENVKGSFPPGQRTLVGLGSMEDFLGNPATIGGTIVGDLDGDRAPDIISLVYGAGVGSEPPKTMLVAFNDGRGGIEETAELPIQIARYDFLGNPTVAGTAVLADLNADKRLDLWVRESGSSDGLGNPIITERWLSNPGRRAARDMSAWVTHALQPGKVAPGVAFGDFDGDLKAVNLKKGIGEWLSPSGYLKPTRSGPLLSEAYDFTNHFIDLTGQWFAAGLDIDGDRDTDFLLGGGSQPTIILRNPQADGGKRRPLKVKEVAWPGELPVVR